MTAVAEPLPAETLLDEAPNNAVPREEPHPTRRAPRHTRIAYLVNQYPQPSHSFIRREIRALESLGYCIERFTLRRWSGTLIDEQDCDEQRRTSALLDGGMLRLMIAAMFALFTMPVAFFGTLRLALRLGRRSDRGLLLHFVYFLEACLLRRVARSRGVDHVHAHFGTNSTTVAMLCRVLGGPTYSFTAHGPEEFDKPEFLHLGEKIARSAFAVAISEFGRSQLCRQVGYEHWSKIKIVRCGVDEQFRDVAPTPPVAEPRLACVARLHGQKGLPVLVEAAARLADAEVRFHLTIIGDGPLRPALERQIAELGLGGRIELAGWKSGTDVRQALLESRALVLPSFAEGLPVVIMEALALHRPVVGTYVAGIPELVTDGVNGRLVPAGAVEPLAEAMCDVIDASVEQLATWGAEGARRVAERHHAAHEAARLASLIEAVKR